MFKLIKNDDIDKERWDHCISYSNEGIVYALSWYLDIVSPGWMALVDTKKEGYASVIPVTIKKKFGIPYIAQPFFTQQLGFFSVHSNKEFMKHALGFLRRKYLLINYNFNTGNTDFLLASSLYKKMKQRLTHVLDLSPSYQTISNNYSTNHKRNIKKASREGLHIVPATDFQILIDLFINMKGEELSEIKDLHYVHLSEIFIGARERNNQIYYLVVDKNNKVYAGGFFLIFQNKIIYMLGASSAEGREHAAMTLLFDEIIRSYAGTEHLLDFEGGEKEGIGRFYKGFGGLPITYLQLQYTRFKFLKYKL